MKLILKRILPDVIAVVIFLLVSIAYCRPSLEGKVLKQPDVIYWKAMAQSSFKYKETHGCFPLWTNSLFCGMPAYFIAMQADNPVSLGNVHGVYMSLLYKPVCFFFLLCMGFYFLAGAFNINPYISIIGSIAYAYASYSSIIIAVGHETKVLAMGYAPMLFAAMLMVYKRKYWTGGALAILFSTLLIAMNHLQVSYYYLLTGAIITICYAIEWIRNKDYLHLFISILIVAVACTIGLCANMVTIATTYDYSKETRKGSLDMSNSTKTPVQSSGYNIDYAFNWSFGITETFSLLIPNIYGGNSFANLSENSRFVKYFTSKRVNDSIPVKELVKEWPQYWGAQPSVSGPVYAGAVVCLLFILGIISTKGIDKWWILTAVIVTLCMGWGKNFGVFNTFIFNHLPFYNKFRAPSMTLVIPQLLFPLLGMLGLQQILFSYDRKKALYYIKITGAVVLCLMLTATVLYATFTYKGPKDEVQTIAFIKQLTGNQHFVNDLYNAFLQDRKTLFANDIIRTSIFIVLAFTLVWVTKKLAVNPYYAVTGLLLLTAADLLPVGKRYLNDANYQQADSYIQDNFSPTKANTEILKDTGYFRVLDRATYTDARTYYYHNSVEGYNPAKLSVIEDLLTNQHNNPQLYNMLNAKYIIRLKNDEPFAEQNKTALGNCWLVKRVVFADGPVAVMKAMNTFNPKNTAVIEKEYSKLVTFYPQEDTGAVIKLIKNDNDIATYHFKSAKDQFAVFSEIYYDRGWKAYIDNKEASIIKTDYALRGLLIPAGDHAIKFEFKPVAYYSSIKIATAASCIGWMAILVALIQLYRQYRYRLLIADTKH